MQYYSEILQHENLITIKAIRDKANGDKIIYHSVYLNHIISEEMWGPNPAATRTLPKSPIPYSYHAIKREETQRWKQKHSYIVII